MRAIVTGGAGFIGSHVADALLARGDEVHVLDDLSTRKARATSRTVPRCTSRTCATRWARSSTACAPTCCFHLAAQASVTVSVADPVRDAEVNVIGTLRVLEAALAHGTRVVFSSTGGAIYGECDAPAGEDAERRPLSPYGTSKLCGEEYLQAFGRLHGTSHAILRYANVYGPRQDPHGEAGVVAIFLDRLAAGRRPRIFGDGLHVRDYVYVGDVARATLAAAEGPAGVFNIGTGTGTTVRRAGRVVRPCRRRRDRAGVRAAAGRRPAAQRPRRLAGGARAGLAARAHPRGRTRRDPGGLPREEGRRRRGANLTVRVDHPLAQPTDSFHPWRVTALVASAVAAVELVVLMVGGVALFGRSLNHHAFPQRAAAGTARPAVSPRQMPAQAPAGAPKLTRGETSVLVLNGNGIAGAAAGAADRVRRFGYMLGGVGNATHENAGPSVIMYRPGYRAEGLRLGRDLHVTTVGPLDGLRPSDLMGAHLAYVVGSR